MKKPVIAILSGGMDSTVLAYHLAIEHPSLTLTGCVSVLYGQRHSKEVNCAAKTAARIGVPHHVIRTDFAKAMETTSLTSDGITTQDVPDGHYEEKTMKATVVPNRNMILISLAVGVAISHKAEFVAYGAHSGDHAIYPDCRPEFANALAGAIDLCDYEPPALYRPFIDLTKADIVRRGVELGVFFDETWTCYKGGDISCGKCGTCVERLEAFALGNFTDPLPYLDRQYWQSVTKLKQFQTKLPL